MRTPLNIFGCGLALAAPIFLAACGGSAEDVKETMRIAANVTPSLLAGGGEVVDSSGSQGRPAQTSSSEPLSIGFQKDLESRGARVVEKRCIQGVDRVTTAMVTEWYAVYVVEVDATAAAKVAASPWYSAFDSKNFVGGLFDCAARAL